MPAAESPSGDLGEPRLPVIVDRAKLSCARVELVSGGLVVLPLFPFAARARLSCAHTELVSGGLGVPRLPVSPAHAGPSSV